MENVSAGFDGCSVSDGSALTEVIYLPDIAEMGVEITVDDAPIVLVAKIGDTYYMTFAEALNAVQSGETIELLAGTFELGDVKFPSALKDVTIKGADNKATVIKNSTLRAYDGSTVSYEGITFDGIVFDNTNILFSGQRASVSYKDWTITNCEFKNVARGNAAISFNLNATEAMENFTFTNNIIDGVTGGNYSGVVLRASKGDIVITGNNINNVAWNAIQLINSTADTITISNNTFASGADEGILNLFNVTASTLTIEKNKFVVEGEQPGICYLTAGDVSLNYWGGEAPKNLPEGVTFTSYYKDAELTQLVTVNPVDEQIKFYGANLDLKGQLYMNIYLAYENVYDGTDYFAYVTIGNNEPIVIPMSQWLDNGGFKQINVPVAAMQMVDTINVRIFKGADVESGTEVGYLEATGNAYVETSVKGFAHALINAYATDTDLVRTIVTMLNYGAAAQVQFNYNTASLANADITAEMQAQYADNISTDAENKLQITSPTKDYLYGTNLDLSAGEIKLGLWLQNVSAANDIKVVVAYTNFKGESFEAVFTTKDLVFDGNGFAFVNADGLVAADLKTLVTFTVTVDGTVESVVDSIESYCARVYAAYAQNSAAYATIYELCKTIVKYGYAAEIYFNK